MKVSVCITTYNHEEFIAQAIESVICQKTNHKYEIIIGEDQSEDKTREIVLAYREKYPNLIKLHLHDYPKDYVRINGRKNFVNNLINAKGEYIALLDGDDYWNDPFKLHKQICYLDSHPECSIVYHPADWCENGIINKGGYAPEIIKNYYDVDDLLKYSNFMPSSSVVYRNNLVDSFPSWFMDCPYGDLPLHILNTLQGKIGFINESMSVYRVHSGGMYSRRSKINRLVNNIICFELIATNLGLTTNRYYREYLAKTRKELISNISSIKQAKEAIDILNEILTKYNKLSEVKKTKIRVFIRQIGILLLRN